LYKNDKNARTHHNRHKAGFFQYATYVPAAILFVLILGGWAWLTFSVPSMYVEGADKITTAKFDFLHVLTLFALIVSGPLMIWARTTAVKWNAQVDEFLHDMPRTAMLDYTIILVSVPMMTIVCAFRGWLEYNMMQYFFMTVICVLVLSLLDDSLLLLWQAAPVRKEVDEKHRSAHFTIITTVFVVLIFFFFTSFPLPVPQDTFHGQLISTLFYVFLIAITAAPAMVNDLAEPRMDSILWVKEGIEVFFRIIVFFWLVSVYNMHYTLE
jgi:hypothetical protein